MIYIAMISCIQGGKLSDCITRITTLEPCSPFIVPRLAYRSDGMSRWEGGDKTIVVGLTVAKFFEFQIENSGTCKTGWRQSVGLGPRVCVAFGKVFFLR